MTKQFWKFPLSEDKTVLKAPFIVGSVDVVQVQQGKICLWCEVDPNGTPWKRTFQIVGTGQDFDGKNLRYVGTIQLAPFVWHIHEDLHGR